MKKYTLVLFAFIFVLGFFTFNTNSVSAVNCASGDLFNTTTGQACGTSSTVVACPTGDLFSSTTGQRCTSWQDNSSSSDVVQFNNLFKSNFKIGLRGNSDVKALQQFLKDQGYYFGKIDGSYGKISARAVKDFQDDNNITNTSTSTNGQPVISGVSGPQTLNINQTGTWTVSASSSNGGNLTYAVNWGDIYSTDILQGNSLIQPQFQSATFTHSYSRAGNYNPTFIVTNSNEQSAKTSLSVNVGNGITTSVYFDPIQSKILINQPYKITWHGNVQGVDITNNVVNIQIKNLATGAVLDSASIKNVSYYSFTPTMSTTSAQVFLYGFDSHGDLISTPLAQSNQFSIAPATSNTNHLPILPTFSAKNGVLTGNTINFSLSATDADNDDLTWMVTDWGDGTNSDVKECIPVYTPTGTHLNWNYNPSHTYTKTGLYTVTVLVTDCRYPGSVNVTQSFDLNVNATATPSITVLSPNGGETYKQGDSVLISWQSTDNLNSRPLYYISEDNYSNILAGAVSGAVYITSLQGVTGTYTWVVPNSLLGKYRILITAYNGNDKPLVYYRDYSDASFDIVVSTISTAKVGDTVSVNYTGRLVDGTVFDSNIDPKFNHVTPFTFILGAGQVIPGWDKGIVGMKVGEKKTLTIAPADAYGVNGVPGIIPPNSTLTFDITLLGIKN